MDYSGVNRSFYPRWLSLRAISDIYKKDFTVLLYHDIIDVSIQRR